MVIGSLVTNIVADLSKWGPNLTKARGQMAGFVKGISTLQTAVLGLTGGAMAMFIKSGADAGSQLQDLSVKLNVTAESLQVFRHAADQMGSSSGAMDKSLAFLSKTLGNAELGSASAAAAFGNLGISLDQIRGQKLDQVFLGVIEGINRLPTDAQQSAAAVKLFGRSGQEMLEIIRGGGDELGRLRGEMEKFGQVASSDAVAGAEAFGDRVTSLEQRFTTLKIRVAGATESILRFLEHANANPELFLGDPMNTAKVPWWLQPKPLPTNFPVNPAMDNGFKSVGSSGLSSGPDSLMSQFQGMLAPVMVRAMVTAGERQQIQVNNAISKLPAAFQTAIARMQGKSLPAPVENFFKGIGSLIGDVSMGQVGQVAGKKLGMVPGFNMTRSGSAESYRQQVRIERQGSGNNKLEQVGNKQLVAQQGMLGELRAIAKSVKDGGVQLVAANFGG